MAGRVLFVDHEVRLSGGQRDLVDLVRAMDDRVDVHVALPAQGQLAQSLAQLGATVHVVPMATAFRRVSRWEIARHPHVVVPHLASYIIVAARLVGLARRLRPSVVHTNSMKAHLLAVPAAKLSRAALVWHMRDILEPGWLRDVVRLVASVAVDRVIAISEATAVPFRMGRAGARTTVVYNGIEPKTYDAGEVEIYRRKLGADDGEPLVGIVGQIAHWKGQDVFVEAAARIARELPRAKFAVVGACLYPDNEAAYERDVLQRVADLGLTDRLVWAGPLDRIEPVMAALDVCVHASRLPEPFGRVVVEALAQGTPVVTTTTGAGPELVPTSAGRVVPPGDAAVLADVVLGLLRDTARDGAMAAAARGAAAQFTSARTADGVLAVHAEVGR